MEEADQEQNLIGAWQRRGVRQERDLRLFYRSVVVSDGNAHPDGVRLYFSAPLLRRRSAGSRAFPVARWHDAARRLSLSPLGRGAAAGDRRPAWLQRHVQPIKRRDVPDLSRMGR